MVDTLEKCLPPKLSLLQILQDAFATCTGLLCTIHMYSGITSGRVLDGELLYTKILEVSLFANKLTSRIFVSYYVYTYSCNSLLTKYNDKLIDCGFFLHIMIAFSMTYVTQKK